MRTDEADENQSPEEEEGDFSWNDRLIYGHLYPAGWDLSVLLIKQPDENQAKDDAPGMPDYYDPTHTPRTFPSGWLLP
jgi:hypothetical protein